tara:strand:- start:84984 stop:85730 length:747 start_codon:yes stop_codon:yes gene_type:complete
MKNQKQKIYKVYGINNAVAVLGSNKFYIRQIELEKNSRAEKSTKVTKLIKNKSIICKLYQKNEFQNNYKNLRSQGVVVSFSGAVFWDKVPSSLYSNKSCLLALDQIEDPQNLGQIIRTAECAGIDGVLISKHHTAPITNTVLQVSQGAFVNIPIYRVNNLRQAFGSLKKYGFWIVGLENSIPAKPWYSFNFNEKTVIVLGSEGKGIREKIIEYCDFLITIPMQGEIDSLNVSAAAAAVLFERMRQSLK